MDPNDLPSVTSRKKNAHLAGLRRWFSNLGEDTTLGGPGDADFDQEAALPQARLSDDFSEPIQASQISPDGAFSRPPRLAKLREAYDARANKPKKTTRPSAAVLATSAADKFLGTGVTSHNRTKEDLPPFIIHPLARGYRIWWDTTVFVAAMTAILEPIATAFSPPGLYPYNSATSILEFICGVLIFIDIVISFNVARYVNGELVTDRKQLAKNYMRLIFWVDLISVIPFDEIALAIAGLNGPDWVNNPTLARYLGLLKLIRTLRCYRLLWFFSYLTYNLAAPLLLVTLLRNVFLTFFLANLGACAFYFEALQAGLGPNTWVGANAAWFEGASIEQMYFYSFYWSMVTMSTTGYGDIRAYNPVEAALIGFWLIFLIFFTAYIIGSITLLIVKGDEQVGKYREEMRALQGYSALHDLPQDLRDSMQRHLKLHFYNADAADEIVLKAYPSSIRRRVLRQLYLPILRKNYLFSSSKQRLLDALLTVARIELYLPQVEIVSEGDYVNDLFILVAGRVACHGYLGRTGTQLDDVESRDLSEPTSSVLPSILERPSALSRLGSKDRAAEESKEPSDESMENGTIAPKHFKYLNPSDVFAEVAFFTGTAQTDTIITLSTTRVLVISRAAFEQVVMKFPTSHKMVLTRLDEHCEDIAMDLFPGPEGMELFKRATAEEGRRSASGTPVGSPLGSPRGSPTAAAKAAGQAKARYLRSFTGGDPTWLLAADRAASLRLTPHQELAVGALLQVKGAVARAVAEHDADKTNEWLSAAARGDTVKIREMLRHGFDPNNSDFNRHTALMLAASRGFRDAVEVLLTAAADPNIVDTSGNTALLEACKNGHDEIIDVLLKKKAVLGQKGVEEGSLLCKVVHDCDLKLLRRLLRCGADPNAANFDGRTALHVAASAGNLPAVEMLVNEGGADVLKKDKWGATAQDDANRVGAKAVQMFLVAEVKSPQDK